MAEDAVESAGAKAPAITISTQQLIARERGLMSNDRCPAVHPIRGSTPMHIYFRIWKDTPCLLRTAQPAAARAVGLEELGIPYGKNIEDCLILHTARHTLTTRLVESGLDYDTIGMITGHKAKELIAHYSHRHPGSVARVAAALEQIGIPNGQDPERLDKQWTK